MIYEKTQQMIHNYLNEAVFSGACYSFIKGEQEVSNTLGKAQIYPNNEKLKSHMLFDVASLTKVICTTTVLLKLYEAGQLDFDTLFAEYYPTFKDQNITLRHLMTHTSDIKTYIPNRALLTQEKLIEAYLQLSAGENIGKKVSYTDTGTILMGFLLEHIYQKSATDIFKEVILSPLKMTESCFFPKDRSQVVPTENHPTRGLIRGSVHDPKALILAEHAGNAGLFSSLSDLQKFVKMYLTAGKLAEKSFLKNATIQWLLQDHTPTKTLQRSIGWDLKYDKKGTPLLFHTGYTGTFLLLDVLNKEAFIFLSNRIHPDDHREAYIEKRDDLIESYLKEKNR